MMAKKKEIKETTIKPLLEEISDLIKKAKHKAQAAINSELVFLYWNIGKIIKSGLMGNPKGGYGKFVVERLSEKLILEFGKGYSRASLFRMIRFYDVFPDDQIVATLLRLLSWSHFIELLQLDQGGIRVARYLTELPPREIFKRKLHEAINRAKSRLNNKIQMRRSFYGVTGQLPNKR